MSSSPLGAREWVKAPVALAIAITAFGAVLASFWCLIAGLWTLSTAEYGAFVGVTAITAFLIAAPVLGFKLASKGKLLLSLATTVPALLLYCIMIIVVLAH
ncbi:hypothetical protein BH09PSE1_BH09PSE1_09990 [soil metagenome]